MLESLNQISLFAAFSAGLLSFVSPCVLPLVPSYLSYITGISVDKLVEADAREKFRKAIIFNSVLFVAGFSSVFIAFGASATLIGQLLYQYQDIIRKVGGVLIIVFGLYLLGLFKSQYLMREHRLIHFDSRPVGYVGSFLIGTAFAAGWTPCVGPVLGAILAYASTTDSMKDGVILLATYSAGLGLPFLLTALGVDRFLAYFKQFRAYIGGLSMVSGGVLVLVGAMLYADSLAVVTGFLDRHGIGWYIGQ